MTGLRLNADMGESFGPWAMGMDEAVMPVVDLANIACGFHASDQDHMRRTVQLAVSHGVTIGAHPAYPDLMGFGRRSMACSADEIENLVLYQIGALSAFCHAAGTDVHYVKPHGALYNDMMKNHDILAAVMRAVKAFDPGVALMTLSTRDNHPVRSLATAHGIPLWLEAFADRAYDDDGHLLSRGKPGAVHAEPETIIEQARRIARGDTLTTSGGGELVLEADTLCVHGDNPESIAAIRRIRDAIHQPAP
ncbi:5-oxoprolinase subunit PxpA [Halospina sp. K52047b]|uniref:5-oxoprolinase subunit PxpA n=1 Tax=Halospina sp. K52047b TaxID=2614160 RepID=UPI00124ADF95|nr:5-oxoprolinase subunit PxpA [Halospina sp. K52047b]KAA8985152.1 LamB/YcsF family protein [Halospina sp. K52047b]